jgi:hypothetical protein
MNFIQALPSQGSMLLPKLETGQRSSSFPSQVSGRRKKSASPRLGAIIGSMQASAAPR